MPKNNTQYTGTNVFIVNVALYTSTNSVLEQTEEKKIEFPLERSMPSSSSTSHTHAYLPT